MPAPRRDETQGAMPALAARWVCSSERENASSTGMGAPKISEGRVILRLNNIAAVQLSLAVIRSPRRRRRATTAATVMRSAFAALRLMSSSILLACWTGKSAGFSPLGMRLTYPPARR